MNILEKFCPKCEQYSIDEAFLELNGPQLANLSEFCQELKQTIYRWTGITVSIGVGLTPTLAKLANHIAKKRKDCGGIFYLIRRKDNIDNWLARTPVGEVWGIGKRHEKKLLDAGIDTALSLKNADDVWIRKTLTVTGLRCALELRGVLCETTWVNPDWKRKTLLHSRSFGNRVHGFEELSQAIASFTARCAERLRAMHLLAGGIWARIRSSVYDGDYYACSGSAPLPAPTSDSTILTACAKGILRKIYTPGPSYAKAAVMFYDLAQEDNRQLNLFEPDNKRSEKLMGALDKINSRYGRLTLRLGSMGLNKADWHMRQERRSPDYTTSWQELPIVNCKS